MINNYHIPLNPGHCHRFVQAINLKPNFPNKRFSTRFLFMSKDLTF